MSHRPVLAQEATNLLVWNRQGIYVDATLGWGGHCEAILAACAPDGRVVGLDRDGEAVASVRNRLLEYGRRLCLVQGNFADMKTLLTGCGVEWAHGVLFDLGMSSTQLDDPSRGFSFRHEGPLDMRMNRKESTTAEEIVQTFSEGRLAQILREYGGERWAGRIARQIVATRKTSPIKTTGELVETVLQAIPRKMAHKSLARVFQALRIEVNQELEALRKGLRQAIDLLVEGGRIVILSYHSLEDRQVKGMFRETSSLRVLTKKPIRASGSEIVENPRAKGAKLRAAERLSWRNEGGGDI